ncbi:MAG TPA: bifunctional phosphopantothenoylcysteine decarboxylase/phosphopantothenate--cysteine ligase CoaBC [Ignavibacteriales bacterium]|nr:bifunctional phosphopantothenoylcysteine decarboxylase/phosphopantothenate--cysteine ligase CoaBC [Ignavibacteriales bacterium]
MESIFSGKKIILGVTGGIAAYKSCLLARELIKLGAEVRVIMTPSALEFIAPLTFSTLTGHEVIVNIFPESQKNGVSLKTWHIEYALWADLMIIAPLTVNTLAKIVHGFADNALTTVVAALRCPLVAVPAADVDMYSNKVTQENLKKLKDIAFVVEAEEGFLASGLSGRGRMAEPGKIVDAAHMVLSGFIRKDLEGLSLLVTAGPTYEDIDPVRFIGNRSSGKMGFQIAKAASLRGAKVKLVAGPTSEDAYPGIERISVRSAKEMKKAVDENMELSDVLIMAAAVADYRPLKKAQNKIKKEENLKSIDLTKTDDILAALKKGDKKVVGFALETDNEFKNAKDKLARKNLDMIVLNSLNDKMAGFEFDTNKVTIITREGKVKEYPLMSKFLTANYILSEISGLL